HHQPDVMTGGALRHNDRSGKRAVRRQVERRSVRQNAGRPAQAEFVLLGKIAINLDLREAPGIGGCMTDSAFNEVLEIAVVLLKMMRSEKQAFRPDDLAIP